MSTGSLIAKEIDKNQYSVIYCHFDGYLEHNGKVLYEHYNDSNEVDRLLDLGFISFLDNRLEPDPNVEHSFKNKQDGVTLAYSRDRGDVEVNAKIMPMKEILDWQGIEYVYIYTLDNKWICLIADEAKKGFKDLKKLLVEKNILEE